MNTVKKIKINQTTLQLLAINLAIFVLMSLLKPDKFPTLRNFGSMFFQFPEQGLLTLGIAITMITAGADLSIVATANLVATINGMIMLKFLSPDAPAGTVLLFILLAVGVALIVGLLCGSVNGLLVGKLGIFPILATLGTMNLYTGICMVMTQGQGVFGEFPSELVFVGSGRLFGFIPFPLIVFIVALMLVFVLIHKTPYGLKTQWFGTNRKASFYAGIDNVKTVFTTYIFSSILGAFTGILILARTNSAKYDYGSSYVLQAMLASVLAGISPLGGRGNVLNVFLSVFALQMIDSGFNFLRISSFVRSSTYGLLLIIGILVEYAVNNRNQKKLVRQAELSVVKTAE